MATKTETINYLNRELKALSVEKLGTVRVEQAVVIKGSADRIESKVVRSIKPKKIV